MVLKCKKKNRMSEESSGEFKQWRLHQTGLRTERLSLKNGEALGMKNCLKLLRFPVVSLSTWVDSSVETNPMTALYPWLEPPSLSDSALARHQHSHLPITTHRERVLTFFYYVLRLVFSLSDSLSFLDGIMSSLSSVYFEFLLHLSCFSIGWSIIKFSLKLLLKNP